MNKYDLAMDIDDDRTPGKIMKKIALNSVVLEFGPANGRMTKYMKEELNCKVFIVEFDQEAFSDAIKFAAGGICCDIETREWIKEFAANSFDYVIFADVLEHLKNPQQVLSDTKPLLKDDGSVFITIPNIAHGDILLKLYDNQFRYTSLGLLDNTHIHFWGYKDLEPFVQDAGYNIVEQDASYADVFTTEQRVLSTDYSREEIELVRSKPLANVYQFFLILQKREWVFNKNIPKEDHIVSQKIESPVTLYFDTGNGFNHTDSLTLFPVNKNESGYCFYECREIPLNCIAVRLDPIEDRFCAICDLMITGNQGTFAFYPINGIEIDRYLLFTNTDPQIGIVGTVGSTQIKFQFKNFILPDDLIALYEKIALTIKVEGELQTLSEMLTTLEQQTIAYEQRLNQNEQQIVDGKVRLASKEEELASKEEELALIKQECEANNQSLSEKKLALEQLQHNYFETKDQLNKMIAMYYAISNSQCWKMTGPLRLVIDKMRTVKIIELIHKTCASLNAYGLKATGRKIKTYLSNHRSRTTARPVGPTVKSSLFDDTLSFASLINEFGSSYLSGDDAIYGVDVMAEYDQKPNTKKILLVSHEMNLTGAPIALHYFAQSLKSMGFCPVIVSAKDGALREEVSKDKIPVIIYERLFVSDFATRFSGLFFLCVANTIATTSVVSALSGLMVPVIWWIHEAEASYYTEILAQLPQKLEDNIHVYCGGEYAQSVLLKHRPQYVTKLFLYYVPDYSEQAYSAQKYQLGKSEGKTIFLLVAAQEARKGQDILTDAILAMNPEDVVKCIFVFVGRRYLPEIEKCIKEVCQRYPDNVIYIEEANRSELSSIYTQADCLLCTSRDDPMPIVVTEAMMLSKLIICSENTGSAALIKQTGGGIIYTDNSVAQLVSKLLYVIDNQDTLGEMCKNARLTYDRFFSKQAFDTSVKELVLPLHNASNVSVIIPTYNAGDNFGELINCLQKQQGIDQLEIIVVDSGSNDNTIQISKSFGVKLIQISPSEFSHSFARNFGAEQAMGSVLLFMTQDAFPSSLDWMSTMVNPILTEGIAAVSCREKCPNDTELFYRVASSTHSAFIGIDGADIVCSYSDGMDDIEIRRNASLNDVACAVKKSIFNKFKYRFDYAEDLDLGIRLIRNGYTIKMLSSTEIVHAHNRSSGYYIKRSLVEGKSFAQIFPKDKLQVADDTAIARQIAVAYSIISAAIDKMMVSHTQSFSAHTFLNEMEEALKTVKTNPSNISYEKKYSDSIVDEVICVAFQQVSGTGSNDRDIVAGVIAYLQTTLKPFVLNTCSDVDVDAQFQIYDSLYKQMCLHIGINLAKVQANEQLLMLTTNLSKGV